MDFVIAALIVVGLWIIAKIVVPKMGWPDWIIDALGVAAGLCILIALIKMAWPYLARML